MIKPIDRLGFGPTRRAQQVDPDTWLIHVTPPSFMGLPTQTVTLTSGQYARYQQWRDNNVLIQDALPELSPDQREILMTGIGDEDFQRMFKEED